jgi:uncharacterized membrane protein
MVEITTSLQDNTIGAIQQFAEIASVDPLVAAMLLSGAIITTFAIAVFGVATLGAVLATLKGGLSGSEEPNQPV